MTTNQSILRGLPRELTHTKKGTPRQQFPKVSDLSEETIAEVIAIRDQLLRLYAPPRYAEPMAPVMVGLDAQASYLAGTRTWHDGRHGRFPVDCPFLVVDDRDATRQVGRYTINDWDLSLNAWVRHILGGTSLLPRWDRGTDGLTSLLIDVDHPFDGEGVFDDDVALRRVAENATILSNALRGVEDLLKVSIPHQLMWTGNGGLWLHIHTTHVIRPVDAARFVTMLAMRWMPQSRLETRVASDDERRRFAREWVSVDPDHLRTCEFDIAGAFRPSDAKDRPLVSFDGGNLVTRPCRLPFARHRKSGRNAVFVDAEGGVIEDQVAHLMSIEPADIDLGAIIEDFWASKGRPARGNDNEVTTKVTSAQAEPTTVDDNEVTTKVTSDLPPVIREQSGRFIVRVEALLGHYATSDLTLDDIIGELHDDHAHSRLFAERALDRTYAWFRTHRPDFTEADVVAELMARYRGTEPDREQEFTKWVRGSMKSGRHLWVNPDASEHPCVASCRDAATEAGLDADTAEFRVLVYIAHKAWRSNIATVTALEVARALDLTGTDQSLKNAIGKAIKTLIELGLIERLRAGTPGHPSVYEAKFALRGETQSPPSDSGWMAETTTQGQETEMTEYPPFQLSTVRPQEILVQERGEAVEASGTHSGPLPPLAHPTPQIEASCVSR